MRKDFIRFCAGIGTNEPMNRPHRLPRQASSEFAVRAVHGPNLLPNFDSDLREPVFVVIRTLQWVFLKYNTHGPFETTHHRLPRRIPFEGERIVGCSNSEVYLFGPIAGVGPRHIV
jgi:hypothetical protein